MAIKKKPAPKKKVAQKPKAAQSRPVRQASPQARNTLNTGAAKPAPKKTKPAKKTKPVKRMRKPEAAAQQSAVPKSKPEARLVTKGQKKAYDRAVRNKSAKGKKRGSRGGNYSLYYIFAAVVLVIVFIVLANTVLFDCSSIEVEGNTAYTAERISEMSGISIGDNLLRADLEKAEQNIIAAFPYIDMAEISRTSPTKIKITVTEAEKWFCMRYGSNTYVVSRRGKIVEQGVDDSLPVVIGYEALEPAVGVQLVSKIEAKTELPSVVLGAAETAGVTGITSLNITDRFEMEMMIDARITLKLGNSTQLENKMYVAKELVENVIGATESVTVDLTNPEKVPVRDNNIVDNLGAVPVKPEETAESTSESVEGSTSEA